MMQIISFTLFSLLFTRTSAATLNTTLEGIEGIDTNDGNMFDLCAKTNLQITSLDINCNGAFTIEIYIATAINESYAPIAFDASSWTLIHQQNGTCQPVGTLTVLNAFNINAIPALINNGDCRGFYVTLTTDSLKYSDGVSVGSIFASNADLDFKEGIGNGYPFGTTYSPRIWNGRIHYNAGTDAPTTATPIIANPTNEPTSDPTQIPSTVPTNIASGNVLSTNITAFQSQNESGKGKGNSTKEFIWIFISVLSVIACINIVCAVFYFNKKRKRLVVKNIANSIIGGETMEDANIENIKGGNECGIELEAVHSGNEPEISDDSGEDLYSHNYKSTVKDETETGGNEVYGTALTTQMHLTAGKTEGDHTVVTDEGSTT